MNIKLKKISDDKRGSIFLVENLFDKDTEFTFMEIKKGFARGGCFHTKDEFFCVIKGKVKLILGKKEKILISGESGVIPANTPHAFIALEESVVSEWGITTEEKEKNIKDQNLRKLVDDINSKN